jgi:hypothetical protein
MPEGFTKAHKKVTRHGKKKVVVYCKRNTAPATPPASGGPTPGNPTAPPATTAGKQASTTTIGATYQDLPPERIGAGSGAGEFKVGQYTVTGSTSPFAVPELRCFGATNCVEPAGTLQSGPVTVPVLAQLEYVKQAPVWKLGVTPAQGVPSWLSAADAASGSRFFQAVGAPDPNLFLPSVAQAPIQLKPHLPGAIRDENEVNDPTTEGSFQEIEQVGSYPKLGGRDYDLVVESKATPSATSDPACEFQVRIDLTPPGSNEPIWKSGAAQTVFTNFPAGPRTISVFVRHPGGMANCGLTFNGQYVAYEQPHS